MISMPPSFRMICERSKATPQTGSSKAGGGVIKRAKPLCTIARAQSMHGKKVVAIVAPSSDWPARAAAKMALRSACSIQTKRPSPSCLQSISCTPSGKVLQATIGTQLSAVMIAAPTLRTRFGLFAATETAKSKSDSSCAISST